MFDIPIHYYAMVNLEGLSGSGDARRGHYGYPQDHRRRDLPHEDGSVEHVVIEAGRTSTSTGTWRWLRPHPPALRRLRPHAPPALRDQRLVDQANPLNILRNFGNIAQAVKENVTTDIPQDRLVDFVDLLPNVSTDRIDSLRVTRAEYATGTAPGRVFYDIDRIRAETHELMNNPEAARERLGLNDLGATCDQSFD